MFNRQTTLRGSFIAIPGHFGEHLGQSIVYARANHVVPPWTEGFNQPPQKPAERPKPWTWISKRKALFHSSPLPHFVPWRCTTNVCAGESNECALRRLVCRIEPCGNA
jgi:hypothetical protein